MRCISCGGEIDDTTKRCEKCGECWGGGNYSVAQTISSNKTEEYAAPDSRVAEVSFLSKVKACFVGAYAAFDDAFAPAANRVVGLFRSRQRVMERAQEASPRRDRAVVYLSSLFIFVIILLIVIKIFSASASPTLEGRWSLEGNEAQSTVVMEFTSSKKAVMWVGQAEDRHIYKEGTYKADGELITISYDDGSTLLLNYELDGNTALFRDPATDRAQKYFRHS